MDLKSILPLIVAGTPLVSKVLSGTAELGEAKGLIDIGRKFLGADKDGTAGIQERVRQAGFTLPGITTYAPSPSGDKAQVRAMKEALQELFNQNNFSVKTGMDTLANQPYMEAVYRKNRIGNYDIYSKSTSSEAASPTIGLGSEKLS